MNIGITGHQFREGIDWIWVRSSVSNSIRTISERPTGYSSLASGADQIFAQEILSQGGRVEAIIPFPNYRNEFSAADAVIFDQIVAQSNVKVLPRIGSDSECYLFAGRFIVDIVDVLIAVWDGLPAAGIGGTADIVRYAKETSTRLIHIDTNSKKIRE